MNRPNLFSIVVVGILFTLLIVSTGCKKSNNSSEDQSTGITDTRDGKIYKTMKVGNQTWFAENLNYEIPDSNKRSPDDSCWCYDYDPDNCKKYGKLYTWHAALHACPPGWHLPSDNEWMQLEMAMGMDEFQVDEIGERTPNIGGYMKSKTGWENNGNGSDSFGFGALPGGYYIFYYGEEIFTTLGTDGYWWTSSGPETTESWYRSIFYYSQFIYRQRCNKQMGYNVRCVKDE